MKLVGISGKIGTGKTAVTNYLLDRLPGNWKRIAFGDVLKQEVHEIYGVSLEDTYKNKDRECYLALHFNAPKKCMTVREILQWHGAEIRRKEDSYYWVNKMTDIVFENRALDGIIVDDVRFENEAELVKEFGGLLVRLGCYEGWECDPAAARHTSETALDNYLEFDHHISPQFGKLRRVAEFLRSKLES